MSISHFLKRNFIELKKGDEKVLIRKTFTLGRIIFSFPFYIIGLILLIIIYLIRPYFLVRFTNLPSNRIGHFAANTEIYCCEKELGFNVPKQPYIDLFFCHDIANLHLAKMWKRKLIVFPHVVLAPLFYLNNFFSKFLESCKLHTFKVGSTGCRDSNLLFEKSKPHLSFTKKEEIVGKKYLEKFGLNENSKFVCLIVRDSGYLDGYQSRDWSYHDFRNFDIDNFILACEELTNRGYFVFRMGRKVLKNLKTKNSKIIDYANSKDQTDFLDIYLGAKCNFCLTTATGFDNIPFVFRKPLAAVWVPLAQISTYGKNHIHITKHHYSVKDKKKLSMEQIFKYGVENSSMSESYKAKGIILEEPSPVEIKDLVIEMVERLEKTWKEHAEDEELQKKFIRKFVSLVEKNKNTSDLHGKILSRFGSNFLKKNQYFLS